MQEDKINIIHILPSPNRGGVQTNLLLKSKYDKKYNIKRKVFFTVSNKGELLDRKNQLFKKNVYCPIIPPDRGYQPYRLIKLYRRWLSIFFVFRLYKALKSDDSKIVHSEDSLKLLSQVLAAFFSGKKIIWQLHTSEKILNNYFINRLFYFFICKGIITIIADSKAALKANFSINNRIISKVHFIQPGIEHQKLYNKNFNRNDIRKKYGFDEKDLILGSTGRLHWAKGYELLLESIKTLILDKGIQCNLVIAGDGQMKTELVKLVRQFNLSKQIIFLGSIHKIGEFLSMLDFYVQPSISEGFPLSVIEAMAARIPVLCSNAGGLPELVEDGETGIIVKKNDVNDLTRGLIKLINTEEKILLRFVEKGYQKASQYSTVSAVKKDLLIYKSLIAPIA